MRPLTAVSMLLLAMPAAAADPAGQWDVRAGDTTVFRFEISRTSSGWSGIWTQPAHFVTDGETFSGLTGPAVQYGSISTRMDGDTLEINFGDPRTHAAPNIFRIHASDGDHATAVWVGWPIEPLTLIRNSDAAPLRWDPDKTYTPVVDRPTNAEMSAMFDADQAERNDTQRSDDFAAILDHDRARRARTAALLEAGALQSGADYYHAAFIYQHGEAPDDFLKAHVLAMVAMARGNGMARWIAAATLDRYLQRIGQPQIIGTQFQKKGEHWTQQPYAADLIPDALRKALHVPALIDQDRERLKYEERDKARAAASAK